MSNTRKMNFNTAKEQIQSVVDSYECMKPYDPDVKNRIYRKVWISARDIEAMWIAIELLDKEIKHE